MIAARISASRAGLLDWLPGERQRDRGRACRDGGGRQRRDDSDAPVVSVPARLRFQRHSHARQSRGPKPFREGAPFAWRCFASEIPQRRARRIGRTAGSRRDIRACRAVRHLA